MTATTSRRMYLPALLGILVLNTLGGCSPSEPSVTDSTGIADSWTNGPVHDWSVPGYVAAIDGTEMLMLEDPGDGTANISLYEISDDVPVKIWDRNATSYEELSYPVLWGDVAVAGTSFFRRDTGDPMLDFSLISLEEAPWLGHNTVTVRGVTSKGSLFVCWYTGNNKETCAGYDSEGEQTWIEDSIDENSGYLVPTTTWTTEGIADTMLSTEASGWFVLDLTSGAKTKVSFPEDWQPGGMVDYYYLGLFPEGWVIDEGLEGPQRALAILEDGTVVGPVDTDSGFGKLRSSARYVAEPGRFVNSQDILAALRSDKEVSPKAFAAEINNCVLSTPSVQGVLPFNDDGCEILDYGDRLSGTYLVSVSTNGQAALFANLPGHDGPSILDNETGSIRWLGNGIPTEGLWGGRTLVPTHNLVLYTASYNSADYLTFGWKLSDPLN